MDFAPQDPDRGLLDSIDYRINTRAKDKTCVDFALHAMVTYIMDSIFEEIEDFPKRGISSIKIFMAYNALRFMWTTELSSAFWRRAAR